PPPPARRPRRRSRRRSRQHGMHSSSVFVSCAAAPPPRSPEGAGPRVAPSRFAVTAGEGRGRGRTQTTVHPKKLPRFRLDGDAARFPKEHEFRWKRFPDDVDLLEAAERGSGWLGWCPPG